MTTHLTVIPTKYHYLPHETQVELRIITQALMTNGKGILAADESIASLGRQFKNINLENSEENRRLYRKLLFSTETLGDFISGVILFDETLYQNAEEDKLLLELLHERKIIAGIKLDKGVVPLYGSEEEYLAQGIDDLGPRCEAYKNLGCHFAKWHCIFAIGEHTPSLQAIKENVNILARFASICQAYRIVPIIEPEVLPDGCHTLSQCQKETQKVLTAVFKALNDYDVFLEGVILRVNMVTPGLSSKEVVSSLDIAEATIITLQRSVPATIAGITFLSGRQSEKEAVINLNEIIKFPGIKYWPLTFCYGKVFLTHVLKTWGGGRKSDSQLRAQDILTERLKAASQAATGEYEMSDYGRYPEEQESYYTTFTALSELYANA